MQEQKQLAGPLQKQIYTINEYRVLNFLRKVRDKGLAIVKYSVRGLKMRCPTCCYLWHSRWQAQQHPESSTPSLTMVLLSTVALGPMGGGFSCCTPQHKQRTVSIHRARFGSGINQKKSGFFFPLLKK